MKAAGFLLLGLLGLVALPALAQDDIEGDIPAGAPFDGTSDRASMFDLEQIAKTAYGTLVGQRAVPAATIAEKVTQALAAANYPGTAIAVTTDFTTQDRQCAPANQVQTRLRFTPAGDGVEVVVASQAWVAVVTYQSRDGTEALVTPTGDCVPG